MVAVGLGSGLEGDAALIGGLGEGVGEQARGAAALAEHEHALAVEVGASGLGLVLGGDYLGGSAGGNALGIGLALEGVVELGGLLGVLGGELLLGDLGLLLALLDVIDLEERIVEDEVDHEDDGQEHEGERLEAEAEDGADGARGGPGEGVHKAVHAEHVDEDLEDPDVGDRGKDERDEEDRVEDDRRGEEQRLVDGEAHGHDGGAADGAHLLGLGEEGEHEGQDEGGAGAAHADDEVLGTLGEDGGGVLTGLVGGEVVGHVGHEGGGDGRLDDGRAVHADEPEEAHGAVDDGKAEITVSDGEERLEDGDDALGHAETERVAEHEVDDPEDSAAHGEGDDVLEGLRDVGRNLLGHLDGDVAADEELVDDAHHERGDERGQKALGAEIGGVEAASDVRGDHIAREQEEADDGCAHARDEVDLVVLGEVAVLRVAEVLGRGGGAGDGEDAHGVVVALPQGAIDVLGPVEAPDVGDGGHEAEDGREDDDGDDGDKAVADRLEVLVAGDRVKEGLSLLDGCDELLHACSFSGSHVGEDCIVRRYWEMATLPFCDIGGNPDLCLYMSQCKELLLGSIQSPGDWMCFQWQR